jgi:hypothetical protein
MSSVGDTLNVGDDVFVVYGGPGEKLEKTKISKITKNYVFVGTQKFSKKTLVCKLSAWDFMYLELPTPELGVRFTKQVLFKQISHLASEIKAICSSPKLSHKHLSYFSVDDLYDLRNDLESVKKDLSTMCARSAIYSVDEKEGDLSIKSPNKV